MRISAIPCKCVLSFALVVVSMASSSPLLAEDAEFSRRTIDLGVVVSNIDKSIDFYTKAIGFTEVPGFSVSAEFATDAGLTDKLGADIRVLVLGKGDGATKVKLMQIGNATPVKANHDYIHSTLGFSYITIFVTDMNAATARLKKEKVKILAKGPAEIPNGSKVPIYLTVVRDPDGNVVELVGPKK